ncbi:MAG: SDR family oxidoreductase [Granulosicoccus sp.]|nr:SDR family oxidoreductase [Granulosicoccus sp.]
MHTLVLGAGYSGYHIVEQALQMGAVTATRRDRATMSELNALGARVVVFDGVLQQDLRQELASATHLISSVPPGRQSPLNDPVLSLLSTLDRGELPALQWVGYLSTIGVYGDHSGAWVDEQTPCQSQQMRSLLRLEAEEAWRNLGHRWNIPIAILRLSGIYGPGRNALINALDGRTRLVIKPDQVFNRIHVGDLATATLLAASEQFDGVVNVTDDTPAPIQDVVHYAYDLLGRAHPPVQPFASAEMSDMARSFYSENKRVSNRLSKTVLRMRYRYPSYREGLRALHEQMESA